MVPTPGLTPLTGVEQAQQLCVGVGGFLAAIPDTTVNQLVYGLTQGLVSSTRQTNRRRCEAKCHINVAAIGEQPTDCQRYTYPGL